ncbi:RdgB/HAM1 family non-canonical purine NTP pyrophosphatase [Pelagibacteraceae bacterium]|nr:RdgB/HAM1 family non-canonical purine NTP pyrophosphatase [Pelagibacteraceae bacterium]
MKKRVIVASHNSGKVREIKSLLKPYSFTIQSASDLKIKEPKETGKNFIENAILKARFVSKKSGYIALADDSGLCINLLDGEPGIYSARWAGKNKDFKLAIKKIEKKLTKLDPHSNIKYRSHFCCALALSFPNGQTISFQGKVYGQLQFPAKGLNGFGYDSIFVPNGYKKTFGEMNYAYKERISHRQKAFKKLKKYLLKI